MEIRQLRYFIAVADTLNFSRAAKSVYLSQSALSRQIMDLEQEVGLPLFRRSTREVELTDAGRALQTSAKELISRWEKMLELMKGICDKTLDCALVLDRELEQRSEILMETYAQEEMVLVLRSANAHNDGDHGDVITNRGLILVDKEPQGLYHIIHILSDLKLEPQIRFCESLEDMTMTVETGESATILPESVVEKLHNPELQVLHLPSDHAKLHLSLLWAKNQTNPLLPELRQRIGELIKRELF